MAPAVCIYCKTTNRPFNREHVIPRGFGTFVQNLVLRDCVCRDCNSYFDKELDLVLSRDSGEALLRLRYGVKAASEASELKRKRIKMTVNVLGPWYGAQVVLKADETGEKLVCEQLPQIGFRKPPATDFVWYREEECWDPSKFGQYQAKGIEIRVVGPSEESMLRLVKRLGELGIPFKQQGILDQPLTEDGKIETVVQYQIDEVIFRAVAKIAFNYLAFVQKPAFALREDFDAFRRYVRYGEQPAWKPAVLPSTDPILFDDTRSWRQTNGHLITLGWSRNNSGILVQLSLFNSITYRVLLCPELSGLWIPISSGHHFDIESKRVSKLGSASTIRLRMVQMRSLR